MRPSHPVRALIMLAVPLVATAAEPAPTETVVRLTVSPQAAAKPALKYQLLPEVGELNPGNPAMGYLACFMEQHVFFHDKATLEKRDKYQSMPLKDLPLNEVRNYGGQTLRRADYAARLTTLDWQVLIPARRDGYRLLLPELQPMRSLAHALKVRFRAEIAENRFDDAVTTAKTMFALSRHLGEHPTMIAGLVGTAIAFIAVQPLDEMIQQPGCPNLYWALTSLPRPLVDLRAGIQGERFLHAVEFAQLDKTASMTETQLKKLVDHLEELFTLTNERKRDVRGYLEKRVRDEEYLAAARKRLREMGIDDARLKQFPALQVVLLDENRDLEERRDDGLKWLSLPYPAVDALLAKMTPPKDDESLLGPFVPFVARARRAQVRLEQRFDLLRVVEALRLHAAQHGRLPARLADVSVPLPEDPVTGKPFVYRLEEGTAIIKGTPPRGEEKNAAFNIRYEVTLRK